MRDLSRCRTAQLGGHLERCPECGFERPVYNSCGNRNCPVCMGIRSRRWLAERTDELLPVPYFHCVFTLPDSFNCLIPAAPEVFYSLMFKSMWDTVKCLSGRYGYGTPGVFAALHTWGQTLWLHPHIHALVTGGGLSKDESSWLPSPPDFLFDVYEMSEEFRKRFCRLLKRHADKFASAPEDAASLAARERERDWVVYCKKPVTGAAQIVEYLSRYSHRTAIADRRILDVGEHSVTFSWKDYRHADGDGPAPKRDMTVSGIEFIRRFMQHILPDSFKRIRSYGIYAGNCRRRKVAICRNLLGSIEQETTRKERPDVCDELPRCPKCETILERVEKLPAERAPPVVMPLEKGYCSHAA